MSVKVAVNVQSTRAETINMAFPQGSGLSATNFLLCIKDLHKIIFWSFAITYGNFTIVFGCTCNNLDDQSLVADLYLKL